MRVYASRSTVHVRWNGVVRTYRARRAYSDATRRQHVTCTRVASDGMLYNFTGDRDAMRRLRQHIGANRIHISHVQRIIIFPAPAPPPNMNPLQEVSTRRPSYVPHLPLHRGDHAFNLFVPPSYLLGPTIGNGEFAKVKLAYDLRTANYVAIKAFSRRSGRYMMLDEQIIRESLAIKGLRHDHIVRVYETILQGNRVFQVMEYCPYGDLRKFINQKGALSEDHAREFFGHLLLAVTKLHSRNLVHRDLKLENILLDNKLRLKVADFGCARRQIGKQLHTITGSYAYGAPELVRGDNYDGKLTDVWSLGVILYAMVTAKLPFCDKGSLQQLLDERKEPPALSDNLTSECVDLILLMLTYDPRNRIRLPMIFSHPWLRARELTQEE